MLTLNTSISLVPLIGPSYAKKLEKLEILTVRDLLYHIPVRYDDFSLISQISKLQSGESVTVQGVVLKIENQFTKRGFVLQKAQIQDDNGVIDVIWFNQRFLTATIKEGMRISLSGNVSINSYKLQMESPVYEIINGQGQTIHTGRLVPVYPETYGITSKWLRSRIAWLINQIKLKNFDIQEWHDQETRETYNLVPIDKAIIDIHFPRKLNDAENARRRLSFDELLFSQLKAKIRKDQWEEKKVGNKFLITQIRDKLKKLVGNLPFELTYAQKKVIDEIYKDLSREIPMNRLLQGDVGSGKTVVAALAMLAGHLNGYQCALMAPTEILANQHFETIKTLFYELDVKVGIATGSKKDYKDCDIVVGTHALLNDKLDFRKLGLVVIDEQHRFGVSQRAKLTDKGINPHVLTMTATPIPRTIALTLYGDLDLSLIDELPKNRIPIRTWVVPKEKRAAAYGWIKKQKTQTFLICPLIEESETLQTVKSAKKEYEYLTKEIFQDFRVGLLHGKMKPKEKDQVLNDFRLRNLDILVATPVVEVGIDIPTATIMVIEAAERFGLAQLHQLRGRVGRGGKQSYCLLFTESENQSAMQRLKSMEYIHSGLKLSEIDLKYRGPGQRFGTAQHGSWDLKIADFSDLKMIEKTNELAEKVIANTKQFPALHKILRESKMGVVLN